MADETEIDMGSTEADWKLMDKQICGFLPVVRRVKTILELRICLPVDIELKNHWLILTDTRENK